MPRTVYVVTHPEATHHVDGLIGGWFDSRLTEAGELTAHAIADALRARIPQEAEVRLFSSDLRRTTRTAETIGKSLGAQPIIDRRLREQSYGDAEGQPVGAPGTKLTPPPLTGDRLHHFDGVPGSETKAVFARRVYAAMNTILDSPAEHQVVVTHGFALTLAVAAWIGMPLESTGYVNFRAPSGSITTLHEDDFWHNRQVSTLGETVSHRRPTG